MTYGSHVSMASMLDVGVDGIMAVLETGRVAEGFPPQVDDAATTLF